MHAHSSLDLADVLLWHSNAALGDAIADCLSPRWQVTRVADLASVAASSKGASPQMRLVLYEDAIDFLCARIRPGQDVAALLEEWGEIARQLLQVDPEDRFNSRVFLSNPAWIQETLPSFDQLDALPSHAVHDPILAELARANISRNEEIWALHKALEETRPARPTPLVEASGNVLESYVLQMDQTTTQTGAAEIVDLVMAQRLALQSELEALQKAFLQQIEPAQSDPEGRRQSVFGKLLKILRLA